MISLKDIGWVAGFLEGEGYPHACRNTAYFSAAQVQRQPLEKLVSLLGGKIHLYKLGYLNCQPCFRWNTGGPRAIGIMFTIFSLMSSKRKEQILKVIEKWKNGRGLTWRGKLTHCQNGHEFTEENIYRHPTRGTRECRICKKKRDKEKWLLSKVNR